MHACIHLLYIYIYILYFKILYIYMLMYETVCSLRTSTNAVAERVQVQLRLIDQEIRRERQAVPSAHPVDLACMV